jgi:hypothetical protein
MSDMYLVQPIQLTTASLLSTTAPDPTPNWVAGTYAKDAAVLYVGESGFPHRWISLVAANTSTPGTDATKWFDDGAGNKYAMFDAYNSSQTTQATGPLVVEVLPGAAFTTLALFNLSGTSVRCEVISSGGATLFDETKSLTQRNTASWSQYYFAGFAGRLTQAIFTGLPFAISGKVRITVTGSPAAIGRMVIGRQQILGCLEFGASPYITDYSRKEWNADFGDYKWVVRDYSRGFRGTVWIDNAQLNKVWSTLIAVRAVPTLWVGSEDPEFSETLVTLGVMQDAPASINYPTKTLLNFTVEGLT